MNVNALELMVSIALLKTRFQAASFHCGRLPVYSHVYVLGCLCVLIANLGSTLATPAAGGHVGSSGDLNSPTTVLNSGSGSQQVTLETSEFGGAYSSAPLVSMPAPSEISISDGLKATGIFLDWENQSQERAAYHIYRDVDRESSSPLFLGSTSARSFHDPSAQFGRDYYYWVQTVDESKGRYGGNSRVGPGFSRSGQNTPVVLDLDMTMNPPVDHSGFAPLILESLVFPDHEENAVFEPFLIGEGNVIIPSYPEITLSSGEATLLFAFYWDGAPMDGPVLTKGNLAVVMDTVSSTLTIQIGEENRSLPVTDLSSSWHQLGLVIEQNDIHLSLDGSLTPVAPIPRDRFKDAQAGLSISSFANLRSQAVIRREVMDENGLEGAFATLPGQLSVSPNVVSENAPGQLIGQLMSTRLAIGRYELLYDPSHMVEVRGNNAYTLGPIDYERFPIIPLQIRATNLFGAEFVDYAVVRIADVVEPDDTELLAHEELLVFGTSPNLADSDEDSWSDFEELMYLGSDPNDSANSIPEIAALSTNTPILVQSDIRLSGLSWFELMVSADLTHWASATGRLQGETFNSIVDEQSFTPSFGNRRVPKNFISNDLSAYVEDGRFFTKLNVGFSEQHTNLGRADQDQDGLSDLAEAFLGTSAITLDTDGDGVIDIDEIAQGLDPLDRKDGFFIPPGRIDAYARSQLGYQGPSVLFNDAIIVLPDGTVLLVDSALNIK